MPDDNVYTRIKYNFIACNTCTYAKRPYSHSLAGCCQQIDVLHAKLSRRCMTCRPRLLLFRSRHNLQHKFVIMFVHPELRHRCGWQPAREVHNKLEMSRAPGLRPWYANPHPSSLGNHDALSRLKNVECSCIFKQRCTLQVQSAFSSPGINTN